MKKAGRKGYRAGCNSVAVKTMKILQNFRITLPFPFLQTSLLEVQSIHPHPTCLTPIPVYMRMDYCGT